MFRLPPLKANLSSYSYFGLVLTAFALALWVRYTGLTWFDPWVDEATQLRDASSFTSIMQKVIHPPLSYLYVYLGTLFLGEQLNPLRSLFIVIDLVGMLGFWLILRRLFPDRGFQVLGLACYALSPLLIYWSKNLRMYALWNTLLVYAFYFSLSRTRKHVRLKDMCLSLALLTHYYTAIYIVPFVLGSLLSNREEGWKEAFKRTVGEYRCFLITVSTVGFVYWLSLDRISVIRSVTKLNRMGRSDVDQFFEIIEAAIGLRAGSGDWAMLGILLIVALSLFRLHRSTMPIGSRCTLALLSFGVPLGLALSNLPLMFRYTLPTTWLFIVMGIFCLQSLRSLELRSKGGISFAAFTLCLCLYTPRLSDTRYSWHGGTFLLMQAIYDHDAAGLPIYTDNVGLMRLAANSYPGGPRDWEIRYYTELIRRPRDIDWTRALAIRPNRPRRFRGLGKRGFGMRNLAGGPRWSLTEITPPRPLAQKKP